MQHGQAGVNSGYLAAGTYRCACLMLHCGRRVLFILHTESGAYSPDADAREVACTHPELVSFRPGLIVETVGTAFGCDGSEIGCPSLGVFYYLGSVQLAISDSCRNLLIGSGLICPFFICGQTVL